MKFLVLLFACLGLHVSSLSGFSLQIVEGSYNWQEAKADAEARGGQLAVLNTSEKILVASNFLTNSGYWPNLWIGLTDEAIEGEWLWLNGNELSDHNWDPFGPLGGEPNNTAGIQHYAYIYGTPTFSSGSRYLKWDDVSNTHSWGYLLEVGIVPEPSTYAILLGGTVLGYAYWRRRK